MQSLEKIARPITISKDIDHKGIPIKVAYCRV